MMRVCLMAALAGAVMIGLWWAGRGSVQRVAPRARGCEGRGEGLRQTRLRCAAVQRGGGAVREGSGAVGRGVRCGVGARVCCGRGVGPMDLRPGVRG